MDSDRPGRRFADDDRRDRAPCHQNPAARPAEPPSNPHRAEQQECGQVPRKPADMLMAAANWLLARKRYQQSRGAIRNESAE